MEKEIQRGHPTLRILHKQKTIFEEAQKPESLDLSIIIPAYNEEKTISSIVQAIQDIVLPIGISYEIIIINDGSTDKTKELAKKSGEKVISLKKNVGKGNALRLGFIVSNGKNLLTVDADGSHQTNDIKKLIAVFFNSKGHMLIGSRFLNKVKYRFTSPTNIVGNKILKYLLFFISGEYITDTQSGLRIFNRTILNSINTTSKGYEIESEITAETLGMGFKVKEIPIECKPRFFGSSHLNTLIDGARIAKTIVLSYFLGRKRRGRKFEMQHNFA